VQNFYSAEYTVITGSVQWHEPLSFSAPFFLARIIHETRI
jgi:hypothetical protein